MAWPPRLAYAFLFLTGSNRRLRRVAPERFEHLGGWLMLLGATWGLGLVALWDLTYRLTWAHLLNWVVPSCACAAAMVLGPHRQAFGFLAEAMSGAHPRTRWLRWPVLVGLTAALAAINHALGWKESDWPTQLPAHWAWLWPKAMYRALLLSPVWGAWGMMVIGRFHRPAAGTDPPTRHLAATVPPMAAAAGLGIPLAGSFVYLLFLSPPLRFVPPAAAVAAAMLGGTALVRLHGRLCREVLLATNAAAQLAFLAACAAVM